ncbi:MAG: hypothetical protein V1674_01250 [Candidatus Omnitrophota bacterium]
MKKFITVVLIVVIALFAVSLVRDIIIKSVISVAATQITGAKVSVGRFSLSVVRQSMRIDNFKMYNPSGFPEGILVDIPKIAVDYDVFSLLKGKLHLRKAAINLKEIGLLKNKEGKLNVDALKVAQQPKDQKPAPQLAMQIDELTLEMGRVVSKDYTKKGEPQIAVYDINLKKTYKNIESAQQLAALIFAEPMKAAGIKGAAIYGVAMLTGVGFIPVVVGTALIEKDSVQQDVNVPLAKLYSKCLEVLKLNGKITKEDSAKGIINAKVNDVNIKVRLKELSATSSSITISARKYMLPKAEIASGILYKVLEGKN